MAAHNLDLDTAIKQGRDSIQHPGVELDIAAVIAAANRKAGKRRTRPKFRGGAPNHKAQQANPTAEQLAVYADWISGMTHMQIAAKYGWQTESGSRLVVRKVNAWLIPQYMEDIRGIKCEHTQRLMHIVCESMTAWEKSKGKKKRLKFERAMGVDANGKITQGMQLKEHTIESTAGDVEYLNAAMSAMKQIREIWGANAPVKMDVAGEINLRVAGLPVQEARNQLADEMQKSIERLRNATPSEN